MTSAVVGTWSADRREVILPGSAVARVIVVPESINPGWTAHTADGVALTPVRINGWQQGWVVPAGAGGAVTLEFASNTPYRVGLFGGLALLPVLALLAWLPVRKRPTPSAPAAPWSVPSLVAGAAVLGFGFVVSGVAGFAVVGAVLGGRYSLRHRLSDRVTVVVTAGGLIIAGAALSRYPWRSVDGYIGHDWGVQLLALIAVAALAVSVVPMRDRARQVDHT